MIGQIGSRALLALALLAGPGLAATQAGSAQTPAREAPAAAALTGRVAVVGGTVDPATLRGTVNGQPLGITPEGVLSAKVAPADYYQVTIEGPGIFASTHSFGHGEIATAQGSLGLPPIEVVARAPGRVEMFFGGDVMIGRRFADPIWGERVLVRDATRLADIRRLFDPMQPYFAGSDLASVNLETVLATDTPGDAPDKSVVFFTHSDAARAIADAGIDYVSLGNNHSYDYLDPGLKSTLAALDAAGLPHAGAGMSEAEALKAARIDVGGNRYSLLGYVGWKGKVEPNQVAEPGKGGAAFGSDENIRDSVAREVAAGRLPIVQYHGSSEYSPRPTAISERRMKLAIDRGAVLVASHHPHVPQGLELYKGRLIAYSLGNFLFDQYFPETQGSIALKVWMDGDALFRAEVIPLQILDYRPVPAVGNFRAAVLRRMASLSAERGTYLTLSGGHGVVTPASTSAPNAAATDCSAAPADGIVALRFALAAPIDLAATCPGADATYGSDILVRGDFEEAHYGDAVDRSWAVAGGGLRLGGPAHGGRSAMLLTSPDTAKPMLFAPKTFFRPTEARRYTLSGWLRAAAPVRVEASVQAHPKGRNRFKALETAPVARIATADLAGSGWRHFRFDFAAPLDSDGDPLPMRPLLRLSGAAEIALDDMALIAWEGGDTKANARDRAMRTHADLGN